uniref:DUF4371 domain-containing protein n=1 Tax=Oryzias latipes TaxID=8090 RepID=A0A3B3HBW8_ORYLA
LFSNCKKLKEYRTFQQDWTEEFAFVEREGSALCQILNNTSTHAMLHLDQSILRGTAGKKACQELLSRMETGQQQFRVWTQKGDWNSASFAALAIVRNGKPFTGGEFAKSFIQVIKWIKDMPLSARPVHDRTIMINLSQLSLIARYVVGDTLHEESLAFAKERNLPMDKLVSVCTDGAPCMVGKNRGFIALLREHEKRSILSLHCILHREALCAQMCGEQLALKTLLDEVGNSYPGLLLHSNVRWLSRGKVLSRFAVCLGEIRTILEMKNVEHPEIAGTEWLLKFFYLVDMTGHLNHLNEKMQGIRNTILSLQKAVFFNYACTASDPVRHLDLQQLAGFISNLPQSFKARFGQFCECTRLFKFITHTHECAADSTDLRYIPGVSVRDFELEAVDLKASDLWMNEFKSLNEDLERLERQQAELASQHKWEELKKLQTAADSQNLERSSQRKTYLRSRLTDGSLNTCTKLNLTTDQPDKTIS